MAGQEQMTNEKDFKPEIEFSGDNVQIQKTERK